MQKIDPYREYLKAAADKLHRELTGMKTSSSAYKYRYGRWLQASEDLVAFERLAGDGDADGGLGQ